MLRTLQIARSNALNHRGITNIFCRNVQTSSCILNVQPTSENADSTIYELRIYSIKPQNIGEFLKLTSEEFHLRTSHSKLFGYWTSEIGGLNQVVHIWEYDSLAHRAKVRANLASDPTWISKYLGRVVGMFSEMTNSAMTTIPGSIINLPIDKGVYELQTLFLNASPSIWSEALVNYVNTCNDIGHGSSVLVGAWKTFLGPKNTAVLLWQHPGPDSILSLNNVLSKDTSLAPYVTNGHTRLLLPHAVSPLQ